MAVRDKNLVAWQAYVITMAFISVGLMLGMFFLYRTYADTAKKSADMSTKYNEALTEAKKSESRRDSSESHDGLRATHERRPESHGN